jgi:hypothetical protein
VSEAALVLDIMRRAPAWAVIIAVIGGGQEIHDGEAGLEAWGAGSIPRRRSWPLRAAMRSSS